MKKRVLHVAGSLEMGGLATVAMNCFRYIDRNQFDFDYLVYGEKIAPMEQEVWELGGRVIHIPVPKKDYVQFYCNIKNVICENGPYDIVHSHTFFNSGIVLTAAKHCGVPKCVAHAHSGERRGSKRPDKALYNAMMRMLLVKNADVYGACAEKAGNYLYGHTNYEKKGVWIPNSVDLHKFMYSEINREEIRKEFGISDNQLVIGNVGNLLPVKNQSILIQTAAELYKQNQLDVVVMIVGSGPLLGVLQEEAKSTGMEQRVIFAGLRKDVPKLLSAFDVFVLPSHHEGLPVSLVEAAANGLPFVVNEQVIPVELEKNEQYVAVPENHVDWWKKGILDGWKRGHTDSKEAVRNLWQYTPEYFGTLLSEIYK